MNVRLNFKKIGNHWYPNILHQCPDDLIIDDKIERFFNRISNSENIWVCIFETSTFASENTLQFAEEDVCRYLTTNDNFMMKFYIDAHEFKISSDLYFLLESNFDFKFYDTLYRVKIDLYDI